MGKEGIGDVYCEKITFSNVLPKRAVTSSLTLREIYISVTGDTCKIGRQGKQEFLLPTDYTTNYFGTFKLANIDLADLWFKPTSTSTVVTLIGTTKD